MSGTDLIGILLAYLLGGICTGYYLVRLRAGTDIRQTGSGGVGARNVGRVLGRSGFILTLLGDALKGVVALLLAHRFALSEAAVALVVVAVIAGHIWPLPLQFRGGRGIATAIGAYLAYDPLIAGVLLVLTALLMLFRRGFILSGLGAFLLLPLGMWSLNYSGPAVAALTASSIMIIYAHRERLRRAFNEALSQREA